MQLGEGLSYEAEATKNLQLPIKIGLKDRGFLQTSVAKTGLRLARVLVLLAGR